ncbi:hypothetical protein Tco_0378582 [Tanacetum coccineum]
MRCTVIRAINIDKEEMVNKEAKSTTRKIVANDQADYYSEITSIMVNGKNAYELKGKFLDDLHKNAFSGTHGEDAVKHIEYFLKIVDRQTIYGGAPGEGGALGTYLGNWGTNEETSDLEETNHDNEQEIDPNLLTKDIEGFKTYEEYKDDWIYEWNKDVPWVHEKPWTNSGDSELKEEALRNKAIMEGMIDDNDESSNNDWKRWDDYEIADHDQEEKEYENEHEDEEICELFDDHELPVCTIRRFEMVKYSFGHNEEYVAIKEDEYEGLANTSKEEIHSYQEIFRMMDEGWMDLAESKEIDNVGGESTI